MLREATQRVFRLIDLADRYRELAIAAEAADKLEKLALTLGIPPECPPAGLRIALMHDCGTQLLLLAVSE